MCALLLHPVITPHLGIDKKYIIIRCRHNMQCSSHICMLFLGDSPKQKARNGKLAFIAINRNRFDGLKYLQRITCE